MIPKLFKRNEKWVLGDRRELEWNRWINETIWKCKLSLLCWHPDFWIHKWDKIACVQKPSGIKPEAFGILRAWNWVFGSGWAQICLVNFVLQSGDKRAEKDRENELINDSPKICHGELFFLLWFRQECPCIVFTYMCRLERIWLVGDSKFYREKDWKDMNEKCLWPIAYRCDIHRISHTGLYIQDLRCRQTTDFRTVNSLLSVSHTLSLTVLYSSPQNVLCLCRHWPSHRISI